MAHSGSVFAGSVGKALVIGQPLSHDVGRILTWGCVELCPDNLTRANTPAALRTAADGCRDEFFCRTCSQPQGTAPS